MMLLMMLMVKIIRRVDVRRVGEQGRRRVAVIRGRRWRRRFFVEIRIRIRTLMVEIAIADLIDRWVTATMIDITVVGVVAVVTVT